MENTHKKLKSKRKAFNNSQFVNTFIYWIFVYINYSYKTTLCIMLMHKTTLTVLHAIYLHNLICVCAFSARFLVAPAI